MARRSTLEERIKIVELARQGIKNRQIAEQVGYSEQTVRKWRRRERQQGRAGLGVPQGRPKRGALSQFGTQVGELLEAWRKEHPGWGATTLRTELEQVENLPRPLPSRATIARYLADKGFSRPYQRHSALPHPTLTPVSTPHRRWQMDAQGDEAIAGVGRIAAINLNDCFSHARLLCYPCQVGDERRLRQPTMEDYQLALRLAFTTWGLPDQLQLDHGSPFFDNHSSSPFPTRLHQWLLALGVEVCFSRRATDQGLTERSHQLWYRQSLHRTTPFADWFDLYTTLLQRREHLNYQLPCRTTANKPPLVACPDAVHSGRFYTPQAERYLLNYHHLISFLTNGRWFRTLSRDGAFSLGTQVYYLGKAHARSQIEITFDPSDSHLACYAANGSLLNRLPFQFPALETLMGQFATAFNLPYFQFSLPLLHQDLHLLRLCETLGV